MDIRYASSCSKRKSFFSKYRQNFYSLQSGVATACQCEYIIANIPKEQGMSMSISVCFRL